MIEIMYVRKSTMDWKKETALYNHVQDRKRGVHNMHVFGFWNINCFSVPLFLFVCVKMYECWRIKDGFMRWQSVYSYFNIHQREIWSEVWTYFQYRLGYDCRLKWLPMIISLGKLLYERIYVYNMWGALQIIIISYRIVWIEHQKINNIIKIISLQCCKNYESTRKTQYALQ